MTPDSLKWNCPNCGAENIEYYPLPDVEALCEACDEWTDMGDLLESPAGI